MSEQTEALRIADELARLRAEAEAAGLGVLGFLLGEAEKEARTTVAAVRLAPFPPGDGRVPRPLLPRR